jgi:hypothetical protein
MARMRLLRRAGFQQDCIYDECFATATVYFWRVWRGVRDAVLAYSADECSAYRVWAEDFDELSCCRSPIPARPATFRPAVTVSPSGPGPARGARWRGAGDQALVTRPRHPSSVTTFARSIELR